MFQDSGFIATVSIRHFSVNKLLSAPHKFFRGRGFPVQAESCSTHTRTKYPLRASGRSRPRGVRHELPHPPSPCAHKIGAHSPQTATRGGSLCAAFAASITRSPATLRHRAASGRSFFRDCRNMVWMLPPPSNRGAMSLWMLSKRYRPVRYGGRQDDCRQRRI